MADDPQHGPLTWRDLNDLRDKMREERRNNTAQIRREIAKVAEETEKAKQTAERVHDIYRKIVWSVGGGTAVMAAAVTLWTLVIQPLWSLLAKQ